jgi:hypothetical protein
MAPPNCKKASLLADYKGASSQCGVNLPVGMAQGSWWPRTPLLQRVACMADAQPLVHRG